MLYFDKEIMSPDPTIHQPTSRTDNGLFGIDLHPNGVTWINPQESRYKKWANDLHLFTPPKPLHIKPDAEKKADLLFDFGTTINAELKLVVENDSPFNCVAWFGESELEARGFIYGSNPPPMLTCFVDGWNKRTIRYKQRGFRFFRLVLIDIDVPVTLTEIVAHATYALDKPEGSFICSDPIFQKVWQSSIYTAKLCTQPHTIWNGIKHGRATWVAGARINKHAIDTVYYQPEISESILLAIPTDRWMSQVPVFSFDIIAMLKQHILYFGRSDECAQLSFEKMSTLLTWIEKSQINDEGFLVRTDQRYYQDIGFLDWSKYPIGGRFEELSWLQCRYCSALNDAADMAEWYKDDTKAHHWRNRAALLAQKISERFWAKDRGFLHTLNHVGQVNGKANPWIDPAALREHYNRTYEKGIALGPSDVSRHCNALGVLANIPSEQMKGVILHQVFNNPSVPIVTTPYFSYFEQLARGMCGDRKGAIVYIRDYLGSLAEKEQSATMWEAYDPQLADIRKYAAWGIWSRGQALDLCSGGGSGAVPLSTFFILGIAPSAPGYKSIIINPELNLNWEFQAVVPTRYGPIEICREAPKGPILYRIPKNIEFKSTVGKNIVIESV